MLRLEDRDDDGMRRAGSECDPWTLGVAGSEVDPLAMFSLLIGTMCVRY